MPYTFSQKINVATFFGGNFYVTSYSIKFQLLLRRTLVQLNRLETLLINSCNYFFSNKHKVLNRQILYPANYYAC
jgi:hypothetical protein